MAGFLSLLPSLIGLGQSSGLFGSLKNVAGNLLKTASEIPGEQNKGWKQLAGTIGKALLPEQDNNTTSSNHINKYLSDRSNNANNMSSIIAPEHPTGKTIIPYIKRDLVDLENEVEMLRNKVEKHKKKKEERKRGVMTYK